VGIAEGSRTDGGYDLVIRGARVIDPAQDLDDHADIGIRDGRIAAVGRISDDAPETTDATGLIASPGWIDLHAHVAYKLGRTNVHPDHNAGVARGVTTVVDAGSCGAGLYEGFSAYVIPGAATRVLAFLNVSLHTALAPRHGSWENFDQKQTITTVARHAGEILGVKVLASRTHCGNMALTPVKLAVQAARLSGTRVMCHIGNAPPVIQDVLALLGPGDIVTHCWHGKPGGVLDRHGRPIPEVRAAADRGVLFDIGHGSESFSFETARRALAGGLPLHTISTDLHARNLAGPVRDMATTMAKFLHLGLSLPQVIAASTIGPAKAIGLDREIGTLRPGACADVTVFRLREGQVAYTDSEGRTEDARLTLEPVQTIRAGRSVFTASPAGAAGR
jgi:dihydroorotase